MTEAEEELRKVRQNREKWGVPDEVRKVREYTEKAGTTLAEIGTSEEELKSSFRMGHMNAAKTWLRMAKEGVQWQEVETQIRYIRELASEADFSLAEIGTSEDELERLLRAKATRAKAAKAAQKRAWNPSVFYPLGILCGFGAAGVLAGINWRRLERPELAWPTAIGSVIAFIALVVCLAVFVESTPTRESVFLINIPPALLLYWSQRTRYREWKRQHPAAEGGGWGIPVLIGAVTLAIMLPLVIIGAG